MKNTILAILIVTMATLSACGDGSNDIPVANAGPDQNITTGSLVTLDGSASSDADGDLITYSWAFTSIPAGSNATLAGATEVRPTFTADLDGVYTVSLVVNDGHFNSRADEVTITAETGNSAPVANAGPDQSDSIFPGQITLDGSASSDADGDLITYAWTLTTSPAGSYATLQDANTANPKLIADLPGDYTCELVVNDGTVDSAPDTVTITLTDTNTPPVANAGPDANESTNTTSIGLNGSSSYDVDSDPLTYAWTFVSTPSGSTAALQNADTANPSFSPDKAGDYVIELVVNDGTVDSAPDQVVITISQANSAPIANAGPDMNVITGNPVALDGSASTDADSDPLAYTWTFTSTPAGSSIATLQNAGTVTPTFTADVDGIYIIKLVVNDGTVDSAPDQIQITAAGNITVNSTSDTVDSNIGDGICADVAGNCTLRAAIQEAGSSAGANIIDIPAGTYTLSIAGAGEDASATGDLDITGDLTINGAGAASTIIDGGALDRVFHIDPANAGGVVVNISGLTAQNGSVTGSGGGIFNNGTLNLSGAAINNNSTSGPGGGIYNQPGMTLDITSSTINNNSAGTYAGGVYNLGTLNLTDSTISGNSSGWSGGAIANNVGGTLTVIGSTISGNTSGSSNGAGVFSYGTLDMTNSTISGNTTGGTGGGFLLRGTATMTNCTIYGNQAAGFGGWGIWSDGATVTLNNTIVVNNPTSGYADCGNGNTFTVTNSLDGDGSCNTSLTSATPLDPLADNGGPTMTHALPAGHPAIDAGDNTVCPATDQRGVARADGSCDIGAFEL